MKITVETEIGAPIGKVWNCWTSPDHITNWNFATDEWCCLSASNDLRPSGKFVYRMEAKDGSMGFDFSGVYEEVKENELITYLMEDGRKVEIVFTVENKEVRLTESFDAEGTNSDEQQRAGWQMILENFKKYVETLDE